MGSSLEIPAILQALIIAFLTFITWLFQSKIGKLEKIVKENIQKQEQLQSQRQNITIHNYIRPPEVISRVEEVPEMFESITRDLKEIKDKIYKIYNLI